MKKPKPPRAVDRTRVVFKFNDGDEEALSLVEVEYQLLRQSALMAASDSASLRAKGNARLRAAAAILAEHRVRAIANQRNASKPRGGKGSEILRELAKPSRIPDRNKAAIIAGKATVSDSYVRRVKRKADRSAR